MSHVVLLKLLLSLTLTQVLLGLLFLSLDFEIVSPPRLLLALAMLI